MTVTPLGTNGFFPSFSRHTACYAVSYEDRLIILDAGSGLFRFAEPGGEKLLQGVENIDIFLSHYHLDHTFGFYAAFKLFTGKKVKVYGMGNRKVFENLTHQNIFPVDYEKVFSNFSWEKLKPGKNEMENYSVKTRRQYHRGEGSLAFRFEFKREKILSYVTDSEANEESVEFAKGTTLLLHEHVESGEELLEKNVSLEKHCMDGHVTTAGAAMVARSAEAGRLYLIHHDPFRDLDKLKEQEKLAQSIFKNSRIAEDFKEIRF